VSSCYLLVDHGFLPPPSLNFYKALRFVPPIGWTPLHLIPKSFQPLTSTLSFLLFLHFPSLPFLVLFFHFFCSSAPPLCPQLDCCGIGVAFSEGNSQFRYFLHEIGMLPSLFFFCFEPQTFSCTDALSFYWLPLKSSFLLEYSLMGALKSRDLTSRCWTTRHQIKHIATG